MCRLGPLRKIGIVLFGISAALAIAWGWIGCVASRKWAAMEARTRELVAEFKQRDARRPVLRGDPVPGNSWEDYAKAFEEDGALKGKENKLNQFVNDRAKADRAAVKQALAEHGGMLEHLRRGARRAEGQFPQEWMSDVSGNVPNLFQSQRLGNLAVCQARFLGEEGRSLEAAELMLDTCQFARDVGHNGVLITEIISMSIYFLALDELHDIIVSSGLKHEEMTLVARQLEVLDASFPQHGLSLLNERTFFGIHALGGTAVPGGIPPASSGG